MGTKKVRVTNELIRKLESEGVENMSRRECRALFRKGYIDRRMVKTSDGSVRHAYKIAPSNLASGHLISRKKGGESEF